MPLASMSETKVLKIRELAASGIPFNVITKKFGIHITTASAIARGETYKQFGGELSRRMKEKKKKKKKKKGRKLGAPGAHKGLADEQIIKIRERGSVGENYSDIGEDFGITRTTVAAICRGRSYTKVGGPRTFRNATRTKEGERLRKQAARKAQAIELVQQAKTESLQPDRADLTTLPMERVVTLMQGLSIEWPKFFDAVQALDRIIRGGDDV